jgi:hypothetical protein
MAYRDWDTGFREVWDELPGIPYFRDYERQEAEILFEMGFTRNKNDADYNAGEVKIAREEFFVHTGLPREMFPWTDWREAMGYE